MALDLNIVWFLLIGILWAGFFVLEGFDFGTGMLLPFVAKSDDERRQVVNAIGPHWDGNEVWLITAGGASFAAFPQWYATMFSGLYLPLFLLLVALIARGVALEFRSKDENPLWRRSWDWAITVSGYVAPLLLGVAFANLLRGTPVDARMEYTGGFFNLLNPYALVAGLATVCVFALHGAIFLSLKTQGAVQARAQKLAWTLWVPAVALLAALLGASYVSTDLLGRLGVNAGVVPVVGIAAALATGFFIRRGRAGWAFGMTTVTILAVTATFFLVMFPRVMVSSTDPAFTLTIYNTASGPYTLKVMTVVAVVFVPIVLAYQAWSYWVFRRRVSLKREELTY